MLRILVVDGEKHIRVIVRQALESWGFAVVEAADGREALHAFMSDRIDLIILDLEITDHPAVETIGMIRELNEDVPIIVVSGGSPTALEHAMAMGANLQLDRPFAFEELLAAIHRLLNPRPM